MSMYTCLTCGFSKSVHHTPLTYGLPPIQTCFEFREDGDSVLDAVLQAIRESDSEHMRDWWERELASNGIPPHVPAVRWQADISRYLHAKGLITIVRLPEALTTRTTLGQVVTAALKQQQR